MKNIAQALREAAGYFSPITDTPLLDAEVLLAHLLSKQRSYLYTYAERILSIAEQDNFTELVKKRVQGQPIAYLTGFREFWSLDLIITPDTLIPRPETELLVELVLQIAPHDKLLLADLGTGCGAIALALARERPDWVIYATDINSAALSAAKANALNLSALRIQFCEGVWCKALPEVLFDIIVSNPPYLAEDDPHLQQGALLYEPSSALIAGKKGLESIQHIIWEACTYLKPGGCLLLEHGAQQAACVRREFLAAGYTHTTSYQDFSGLDRVTTGVFGIECVS
jgi:release factor glutamine methyltransferase